MAAITCYGNAQSSNELACLASIVAQGRTGTAWLIQHFYAQWTSSWATWLCCLFVLFSLCFRLDVRAVARAHICIDITFNMAVLPCCLRFTCASSSVYWDSGWQPSNECRTVYSGFPVTIYIYLGLIEPACFVYILSLAWAMTFMELC